MFCGKQGPAPIIEEADATVEDTPGAPRVEKEGSPLVEDSPSPVEILVGTLEKKKRRKGENINPKDWERNVNAAKRKRGEPYFGLKKQQNAANGLKYKFNNERKGKEIKDRCSCKNGQNFKCEKITDLDRNKLFKISGRI